MAEEDTLSKKLSRIGPLRKRVWALVNGAQIRAAIQDMIIHYQSGDYLQLRASMPEGLKLTCCHGTLLV